MTRHALTLTLLIVAEGQQRKLPLDPDDSPFEYDVHNVIERATDLAGWSDERKADLYSLIVETAQPTMKLTELQRVVSRALITNASRYGHD